MRIEHIKLTFASEAEYNKALDAIDRTFPVEVLESLDAAQTMRYGCVNYWTIEFNEPITVGHFENFVRRYNE